MGRTVLADSARHTDSVDSATAGAHLPGIDRVWATSISTPRAKVAERLAEGDVRVSTLHQQAV